MRARIGGDSRPISGHSGFDVGPIRCGSGRIGGGFGVDPGGLRADPGLFQLASGSIGVVPGSVRADPESIEGRFGVDFGRLRDFKKTPAKHRGKITPQALRSPTAPGSTIQLADRTNKTASEAPENRSLRPLVPPYGHSRDNQRNTEEHMFVAPGTTIRRPTRTTETTNMILNGRWCAGMAANPHGRDGSYVSL